MNDFLSSTDFVPRSQCGNWSSTLMVLYVTANALIGLAYLLIPLSLLFCLRKSKSVLGSPRQVMLFAAFILACGAGHVVENVGAFWWPNYRFFTAIHWLTAVVSLATACTFPRHIARLAARPRREIIEASAIRMANIIEERRKQRDELEGSDSYRKLCAEVEALKQVTRG